MDKIEITVPEDVVKDLLNPEKTFSHELFGDKKAAEDVVSSQRPLRGVILEKLNGNILKIFISGTLFSLHLPIFQKRFFIVSVHATTVARFAQKLPQLPCECAQISNQIWRIAFHANISARHTIFCLCHPHFDFCLYESVDG